METIEAWTEYWHEPSRLGMAGKCAGFMLKTNKREFIVEMQDARVPYGAWTDISFSSATRRYQFPDDDDDADESKEEETMVGKTLLSLTRGVTSKWMKYRAGVNKLLI